MRGEARIRTFGLGNDLPRCVAAKPRSHALLGQLADGKQLCAHQALAATALLRVGCLRIRGGRARGNQNFDPRLCPPGFSRVAASLALAPSRGGAVQQLARCVAHQALVAAALLRVSCLRIRGGRARGKPKFLPPPSLSPGFFPSCGKPGWHHRGGRRSATARPPCYASSPCGGGVVAR